MERRIELTMAARDSIRSSDSFTKMKRRLNAFAPDAARPDTCNCAIIQRPREFESDRTPSRQLFLSNRSRKGIRIPVSRASCNRVPRLLFRRLANPLSGRRRNRWQAAQRGVAPSNHPLVVNFVRNARDTTGPQLGAVPSSPLEGSIRLSQPLSFAISFAPFRSTVGRREADSWLGVSSPFSKARSLAAVEDR